MKKQIGDNYRVEIRPRRKSDYGNFEALQRECEKWKREALQQYPTPEAFGGRNASCSGQNS